ncbi:TetR family transcriptional regulator [Saccharopolyspora sp. NFXS83]|uniref:TetR/AcrR family transcriptional regulator n=1 Tax=Saccharopolyspora sp. NFXS83 TaxID=2993560 RepID=UPI00224B6CF0|nr:TetR/AcrR family transcriptional regulator [Saccharopolyspora sp. NFXS83]MCX2732753.1 TetR family transcriptional regulator [Saccharopolyspora sp. NFXS83]
MNANKLAHRSAERPETGARETARRTKTRERLMDAAYRQFSEHGINGTPVEAITDDAGFTRGAFYSNFGSKEELFFALTERENRVRLETLREHFAGLVAPLGGTAGKPAPHLIEGVIADVLSFQPDNRQWCLMQSEFRLLALRDPEVAPRFLAASQSFLRELAAMVDTAVQSVGVRFLIDTLDMTRLLVDQFDSAMQEAILSGAEDPELAVREHVMRTLPLLVHSLTDTIEP